MRSLLDQYELSKVFNGRVNSFSPSILKWRSGAGRSRLRRIVSSTTVFLTYFKHGCVNRLSCPLFGYSASSIVISNYRGLLVWRNTLSTIIFAFMRGYSMHRTTACGRKRTFISLNFRPSERPVSGKADVQSGTLKIELPNVRLQTNGTDVTII